MLPGLGGSCRAVTRPPSYLPPPRGCVCDGRQEARGRPFVSMQLTSPRPWAPLGSGPRCGQAFGGFDENGESESKLGDKEAQSTGVAGGVPPGCAVALCEPASNPRATGLPRGLRGKESACQCRRPRFVPNPRRSHTLWIDYPVHPDY